MRKRILKKSEVLREGYVKGLKKAQTVINEMLVQTQGFDEGELEGDTFTYNGKKGDDFSGKRKAGKSKANDELLVATQSRTLEKVYKALKSGAFVDAKYKLSGKTPLLVAAENGDTAICELLLSLGADIRETDKNGWTALHYAARNSCTDVIKKLLQHGAYVNAKDKQLWTPLHWAARLGDIQTCKLLLAKHANVDAKDEDGWTPLHAAALLGNAKVCELLLDAGADVNAKDNDGIMPLNYAMNRNMADCCKVIRRYMKK